MTKQITITRCLLSALLCLPLCGCAGWTRPASNTLSTMLPQRANGPEPPSRQFRPIVRGSSVADEPTETPAASTRAASTRAASTRAASRPTPTTTPQPPPVPSADAPRQDTTTVIRGQQPDNYRSPAPDEKYERQPLRVSSAPAGNSSAATPYPNNRVTPAQYTTPSTSGALPAAQAYTSGAAPAYTSGGASAYTSGPGNAPVYQSPPTYGGPPPPPAAGPPIGYATPFAPEFQPAPTDMPGIQPYTGRFADLIVNVREQQTGRFMFGVGVNSDAGLTAQVVLDEYNFDWKRFPRNFDEIIDGTAWRGGGQRLRIEAIPGSQLQRYLVNFTEPYLLDSNISLNLSAFLYDRRYFDWDEQRLGGRIGLGYRLTPDLSLAAGMRLENVNISDPRVNNVQELSDVLGDNSLYSGRLSLTHDTRDSPFAATEGHLLEITFEQVFGTYQYPRGIVDYRRYFLLNERPDGSGRHTLGSSLRVGISGANTPLYENFFAGGYSTIRGFRFRSANPKSGDVYVGGEFSFLGSFEYMFPITADDMLKGVVFCDYGTIEEKVQFETDDFRVAFGAGLRISIPAMGPAPIALDFAIPVTREDTDRIQNFSFFVGFGR